jgi:hypothetical protein
MGIAKFLRAVSQFCAIDQSTTMGVATGDLQGAVSGTLLGAPQPGAGGTVVFHVPHHWVTESGDTLSFDPATATTFPLSQTLFAIVTYPLHLTGGRGRFAGATGDIWRGRFERRDGIPLQRTSVLRGTG